VVYWKGSCPLLVGGLLLLKEVLLLQRQEEGSQKEGAPMSLNRDLNRNLNRARGTLWCVGRGQKQGIEVLCNMRWSLHWLLSGALILLKGSTAPA